MNGKLFLVPHWLYSNRIHERVLLYRHAAVCAYCPGSSSSLYVRSIEYEESLRHYTHRHTHLLFESKREKQLGDTGDVRRKKKKLPRRERIPAPYSYHHQVFSFPQTLACKEEANVVRGWTLENVLLIFSTPFLLQRKPLGFVITKSVTHCNVM